MTERVLRGHCATCNKPKLKINEVRTYTEAKLAEDKAVSVEEKTSSTSVAEKPNTTEEKVKPQNIVYQSPKPVKPIVALKTAVFRGFDGDELFEGIEVRLVAGQLVDGLTAQEVAHLRFHGFVE